MFRFRSESGVGETKLHHRIAQPFILISFARKDPGVNHWLHFFVPWKRDRIRRAFTIRYRVTDAHC